MAESSENFSEASRVPQQIECADNEGKAETEDLVLCDGSASTCKKGQNRCSGDQLLMEAIRILPSTVGFLPLSVLKVINTYFKGIKPESSFLRLLAENFNFTGNEFVLLKKVKEPVGALLEERRNCSTELLIKTLISADCSEVIELMLKAARASILSNSKRVDNEEENSHPPHAELYTPLVKKSSEYRGKGWNMGYSEDESTSCATENDDPLLCSWNSTSTGVVLDDPESYYSEESKTFWDSIEGPLERKDMNKFKEAMKELFKDNQVFLTDCLNRVYRFIMESFHLPFDVKETPYIRRLQFVQLVAHFGPATKEKTGCFQKIFALMKGSLINVTRKGRRQQDSWFAGAITKIESHKLLKDKEVEKGDFLIRYSESEALNGYFVLGFVTENEGPVEVQIKNEPVSQTLCINQEKFMNLVDLVTRCKRKPLTTHNVLLRNPCPNIGMTAVCKGYATLKKHSNAKREKTH